MAGYISSALIVLLSQKCYNEFFVKYNFLDGPCLKVALSKALGYGIIAGSIMVKVPQIIKILQSKSAVGISILSILLDLLAITSSASYHYIMGFPFSSWGEGMFLIIQTATIATLVLHFSGQTTLAAAFVAVYAAVLGALMSGLTPIDFLWGMQALNVPLILVGKLIQAYTNYRNQSTGQLSAVTGFLLFFGSTARIFTSVQETGDPIIIITYCCASAVNAIIAAQIVYYWNSAISSRVKKSN